MPIKVDNELKKASRYYQAGQLKTIALLGNSGSGKTTFAESMLFNGGTIDRRGSVETKNTASDYRPIEQENENSLFSTVLYTEYQNKKINILDTPGLDDFGGGVVSSLHAADASLLLINVQNGVEVGSEIHFRHAEKAGKPVIIAVNGKSTATVADFKDATEGAVGALVDVIRFGRHQYISVSPPDGKTHIAKQNSQVQRVGFGGYEFF